MHLYRKYNFGFLLVITGILGSCSAGGDNPGTEFSPNMYNSVAYEPYTQITDTESGLWLSSGMEGRGEFYNSNTMNPYGMNMRQPPANTVPRGRNMAAIPYRIPADSVELAARSITNPVEATEQALNQGQALYTSYCYPCHGKAGQGDGPVGQVYLGVANFASDRLKNAPEGHIFHVITHGRGRMYPHGSQISPEDRWKIVHYVKTLQKQ
ncbi:MAG: cytochrome c [Bacteroidota bacterium]|nr:cytochrome c [Bacteroidota bacterium]MDQ3536240.1 cytochrome c [Bacteroidota bacterium]